MYDEKIEALIKAALADGVLTEKEKQVLFKRAQEAGIDLDEFEMVLDARLVELQKAEKEKAEKSAPKSDKYGSVRKCPACGAIVGAFKGVCPECGFEFTEVDANLSSKKLYDALSKESNTKKKQEIIETFPLPNTKADLLEFLTALKPRIADPKSEFANAYYKKYAECIEKAKVSFFGDKQLQPFIDDFNQFYKELKKKKLILLLKRRWKIVTAILIVFIIVINSLSSSMKEKEQKELFAMHISNKDADKAKEVLQGIGVNRYDMALEVIKLYAANNDFMSAKDVYEELTPGHCGVDQLLWDHERHGANGQYEPTVLNLIRKGFIEMGEYDLAWEYSEKELSSSPNWCRNAADYFNFMSEVVIHLCQKDNKTAAKKFVRDYSVWFINNVDPEKDDEHDKDVYKNYNSVKAKSKLLQMIAEY